MAYLDKTNIGNAKIEGLLDSLHMTGVDYNIALSVFFIPFVLAEVPSNMVLHMFKRPSLYIGGIVTCWGVVMTCNGVVQNFGGLVAVRIFLGLFEYVHVNRKDLIKTDETTQSRFPPWCDPDHLQMVPTQRDANPNRYSLHLCRIWWGILRSPGVCNRQNGWSRRIRGLEMGKLASSFQAVQII